MSLRAKIPALMIVAASAIGSPAHADTPMSLKDCAALPSDAERLACYDRLSGHTAPAPAAGPSSAGPAAPAPATPAPKPPAASAAAPAPAPPAAPAAGSSAPARNSFGLYQEEHPKPAPGASSTTAKVLSFGRDSMNRRTVMLEGIEGNQLWELMDGRDALLNTGDLVTIQRATFGSFILYTPAGRSHRVRRLK
ncbi:MAG: hypothetical protein JSS29_17130 [Proteobacteria bacterium]|nr:hypothetical protein [Pseudomonadota bacterium]